MIYSITSVDPKFENLRAKILITPSFKDEKNVMMFKMTYDITLSIIILIIFFSSLFDSFYWFFFLGINYINVSITTTQFLSFLTTSHESHTSSGVHGSYILCQAKKTKKINPVNSLE